MAIPLKGNRDGQISYTRIGYLIAISALLEAMPGIPWDLETIAYENTLPSIPRFKRGSKRKF
jgi:hypothetical protein